MSYPQAQLFELGCFCIIHHIAHHGARNRYERPIYIRLGGAKVFRVFDCRLANTPHPLEVWAESTQPGITIIKVTDYESD